MASSDITLDEMGNAIGLDWLELEEILRCQKVEEKILARMRPASKTAKLFDFSGMGECAQSAYEGSRERKRGNE